MNREDIDKLLTGENNEVLKAHSEIVAIQKDKSNILKFGQKWLDDNLVGGLNNKMVFVGSRPSNGKTFHCSTTISNLLDKTINPMPIKILRCNLEMPTSALLLREVSKELGLKPSEILENPYSEADRPKVKKIVDSFMDSRITNVSIALKGDDYKYMIEKFIRGVDEADKLINDRLAPEEPPVKTKKIILTDHIHVYLSKENIDSVISVQNDMKMLDRDLSFINYFQLNRDTELMWRDSKDKKVNPKNMLPNSGSIYLTDLLMQFADLVIGMVIPQVYDLDEFCAIHKERNIHLKEHFTEDNPDNSFVRVKGRNRIYYALIKIRMLDSFDDPRLFCEILNPEYEKTAEKLYQENKNPFSVTIPRFDNMNTTVGSTVEKPIPSISLSEAFDVPDKTNKTDPF